jgi:hypothetical protein
MSSILIVAEKLSERRTIDTRTVSLLTINFAVCALWSPFFAAMAYTLSLEPIGCNERGCAYGPY